MSEDTGNGEVETTTQTPVATRPAVVRFAEYLAARAEMEAPMVAQELSSDQMERILSATTEEELDAAMEMAGLIGLRDLADGQEVQINNWHVAKGTRSEFMNSLGVFAVLNCQDLETGHEFNADTGIERVIAYLRMCEQFDRFPVQVRIAKTATGSGDMITLLPLRRRAVQASAE